MEKSHVKMCIRDHLRSELGDFEVPVDYFKNRLEADVDLIANQMTYEPPGLQKFSTAGCKKVTNLVKSLIVMRSFKQKNEEL